MLKIVNSLRDYQFKVHDCLWGLAQMPTSMPILLDWRHSFGFESDTYVWVLDGISSLRLRTIKNNSQYC